MAPKYRVEELFDKTQDNYPKWGFFNGKGHFSLLFVFKGQMLAQRRYELSIYIQKDKVILKESKHPYAQSHESRQSINMDAKLVYSLILVYVKSSIIVLCKTLVSPIIFLNL
jgi:hypothetical protein